MLLILYLSFLICRYTFYFFTFSYLEVNSPDSEFLLALQNSVVCVEISHLVRYLDF